MLSMLLMAMYVGDHFLAVNDGAAQVQLPTIPQDGKAPPAPGIPPPQYLLPAPPPVSPFSPFAWFPLKQLGARDRLLADLSADWTTQVFNPGMAAQLAHQRRLPLTLCGGFVVAVLQLMGCPVEAGVLSLVGLVTTGEVFPDLWRMTSVLPQMQHQYMPQPTYFTSPHLAYPPTGMFQPQGASLPPLALLAPEGLAG